MSRYYKVTENGKLVLVGIGDGGEEITKAEYDSLLFDIRKRAEELEHEEGADDGSD